MPLFLYLNAHWTINLNIANKTTCLSFFTTTRLSKPWRGVAINGFSGCAAKNSDNCVSVISFWETALLIEKRRLTLKMNVNLWRKSLIDNGLKEVDLTGDRAIFSAGLSDSHGDLADR